jgi:hypothetical protein
MDYCKFTRERGRQKEREGRPGRGRRRRRASWRAGAAPEGVTSSLGQAGGGELRTSRPPRSCSPFKGRRQEDFVKSPLTLEGFLGKTKQHLFTIW